jgi:SMC proteins Flexible Hinge Domain
MPCKSRLHSDKWKSRKSPGVRFKTLKPNTNSRTACASQRATARQEKSHIRTAGSAFRLEERWKTAESVAQLRIGNSFQSPFVETIMSATSVLAVQETGRSTLLSTRRVVKSSLITESRSPTIFCRTATRCARFSSRYRRVVEGVIRDVLLGEDADEAANAKALSIFEKTNDYDDGEAEYIAEVKNVRQFLLCLGLLQYNASFRVVSGILQVTKTITGMSRIGSCTVVQAARVARIACAANLENVAYWAPAPPNQFDRKDWLQMPDGC